MALGKWVAIRLRWPRLAEDLDRDGDLLKALETHANGSSVSKNDPPRQHEHWFSNTKLLEVLKEENPARRLTSLPLDSFLRVA